MSILLLSMFAVTVKSVCRLIFVHPPPNVTESTPRQKSSSYPRTESGSFPVLQSFHPDASTQTYIHVDWILRQLSSPDLITGPAGMAHNIWIAVIILRSFRDIKLPSALLKRPAMHHSSPKGLLWMIYLDLSFIIITHKTLLIICRHKRQRRRSVVIF